MCSPLLKMGGNTGGTKGTVSDIPVKLCVKRLEKGGKLGE